MLLVAVATFSDRHRSNHVGPFLDLAQPLEGRAFIFGLAHWADEVLAIIADSRQLFHACMVDNIDDVLTVTASASLRRNHRAIGQKVFADPAGARPAMFVASRQD